MKPDKDAWERAKFKAQLGGGEPEDYLDEFEDCLDEGDTALLAKTPTLLAFIKRAGAKPKSFRKYVIYADGAPSYGKLHRITGTITIGADGTVKCSHDIQPPTDEEAAAIKAEISSAGWPTSMNANLCNLPLTLRNESKASIYLFLSQCGKEIMFIQHRKDTNGKSYIPWSYWSDCKWRQMEPDGLLPLYGLERLQNGGPVFLHEGTKAARGAQDFAENKDGHPWAADLKGTHIGWIGGADSSHRTDWSPLRSLPHDQRLAIVADNDQKGIDAVSGISRQLRRPMTAVVFDDNFRSGFDLADLWPQHPQWWRGTRYIGPTIDDLSRQATWATESPKSEGKGRPGFQVRDEFAKEWGVSLAPHVFAHRTRSNYLLQPDVFNRLMAPFSDAEDTARLLAKKLSVHADGIAYEPQQHRHSTQIVTVDGFRLINTFRPAAIRPAQGNVQPFLRYMRHLIPDRGDRRKVMRWAATLAARPNVRMRYALLLISETQGIGKTTLGEAILAPLVGRWNVSFPSEQQVTDSAFNSWMAHKRLAVIGEMYTGDKRKCYDRLKSAITDAAIEVNKKYLEPYTVQNWIHIVASSNSIRALHLDDGDRRWLVPRVTEQLKSADWWREFYAWLNGEGLSIIAAWAEAYVTKHGAVGTGEHAPATTAKMEVIAESRSDGQRLAFDLGRAAVELGSNVVLRVDEVRAWVAEQRGIDICNSKLERPLTLRKALVAAGLREPPRKADADNRIKIDDRWQSVVANFEMEPGATWAALKQHHKKPHDLAEM